MQTNCANRTDSLAAGKHWQALNLNGHKLLNKCAVPRRTDAMHGPLFYVGHLLTQLWGQLKGVDDYCRNIGRAKANLHSSHSLCHVHTSPCCCPCFVDGTTDTQRVIASMTMRSNHAYRKRPWPRLSPVSPPTSLQETTYLPPQP